MNKIIINTSIENLRILQETDYCDLDNKLYNLRRIVIDTADQQVKDALIKLGWTPPKE